MKIKQQIKTLDTFQRKGKEWYWSYVFYLEAWNLRQNSVIILRDTVSAKLMVDLFLSVALLSIWKNPLTNANLEVNKIFDVGTRDVFQIWRFSI